LGTSYLILYISENFTFIITAFETPVRTWRIARLYSEIAVNTKSFRITQIYLYNLLHRMNDTATSQNIDLRSWNILYTYYTTLYLLHRSYSFNARIYFVCDDGAGITNLWTYFDGVHLFTISNRSLRRKINVVYGDSVSPSEYLSWLSYNIGAETINIFYIFNIGEN
jgi:hypothetical protein